MMKILVYAGPSIARQEIVKYLPSATILPPIKRGDLVRQNFKKGDFVIIIDGYFHQAASIQHMEIIYCIQRGVTIIGCSSMGALRAAELSKHGMIGYGLIYQLYKTGLIIGDDEVAILHDTEKYKSFSDALVDIRFNLKKAVNENVISNEIYEIIINGLKNQWFGNRTYQSLYHWLDSNSKSDVRENLEYYINNSRVDLKWKDAAETLVMASRLVGKNNPINIPETAFLRNLKNEYSFIENSSIQEVDVINYCRLFDCKFAKSYKKIAELGVLLLLNSEYRKYDVEQKNRLKKKKLYIEWLLNNNLTLEEVTPFFSLLKYIKSDRGNCLSNAVISELESHGYIGNNQSQSEVNCYLYPLRIYPGVHWIEPILTYLKMRGIYQKVFHSLRDYSTNTNNLEPQFRTDGKIVSCYTRIWQVPEGSFKEAVISRGFSDVSSFIAIAKKEIFLRKMVEAYENMGELSENIKI